MYIRHVWYDIVSFEWGETHGLLALRGPAAGSGLSRKLLNANILYVSKAANFVLELLTPCYTES
jgi:hypothetical protein